MAFVKNIIDLKGILTLMVLTLPSIAANFDCNGKPFHCVNSTHFMICVDLGSGVSSTIDDFVIPCPPTTVCQSTNKFECEFPTVTVAPLVTSVSDTTETVTTPPYNVTTSVPIQEYLSTISTTLSEDVLITHQTIATEATVQQVTDTTQNIEVIIPGLKLNESIPNSEIKNDLTTPLPISDEGTTVTEPTPGAADDANVIIPSTYATKKNINAKTHESITNSTLSESFQNLTSVTQSEGTFVVTSSTTTEVTESIPSVDFTQNDVMTATTLPNNISIDVIEPSTILVTNMNDILQGSELNFTVSESNTNVDVAQNLTLFLNYLSPTTPDTTEYLNMVPKINVTLSETVYSGVMDETQNNNTLLSTSDNTTLLSIVSETVTELILTEVTEIAPIPTFNDTTARVNIIAQYDLSTNVPANTSILISDVTENVKVMTTDTNSSETITSAFINAVENENTPLLTNNSVLPILNNADSTTETIYSHAIPSMASQNRLTTNALLPDNTDTYHTEPITDASNLILNATEYINVVPQLHTTSNTTLPSNVSESVTESIVTEVTQITPITTLNSDITRTDTALYYDLKTNVPNVSSKPSELISVVTENVKVMTPDMNSILGETTTSAMDTTQNEHLSLSITTNTLLTINIADATTETILNDVTETIPSIEIQNDIATHSPLPYNTHNYVAETIPDTTIKETSVNETTISIVQNNTSPTTLSDKVLKDLLFNFTGKNNFIPEFKVSSNFTETIAPLNASSSFSSQNNIPNIITKLKLTEATPSVSNDFVRNYLTTLYMPNNSTALPDQTIDIVTEFTVSTDNISAIIVKANLTKVNSTLKTPTVGAGTTENTNSESISTNVYEIQNNITSSSNASLNDAATIVTEPTIFFDVTPNVNSVVTETFATLSPETISESNQSSSTISSVNDSTNTIDFVEASANSILKTTVIQVEDGKDHNDIGKIGNNKTFLAPPTLIDSKAPTEEIFSSNTEATSIIDQEQNIKVTNSTLGSQTYENVLPMKNILESHNISELLGNISVSNAPAPATLPKLLSTTDTPKKLVHSIVTHLLPKSSANLTAIINDTSQLNATIALVDLYSTNISVTENHRNETLTEQATLATTITETIEVFLEASTETPILITESAVFSDLLSNSFGIDIVSSPTLQPLGKEETTVATSSTTTDSEIILSSNESTSINQHVIKKVVKVNVTERASGENKLDNKGFISAFDSETVTEGYDVRKRPANFVANNEIVDDPNKNFSLYENTTEQPTSLNTTRFGSVFYPTTEVSVLEDANDSNVEQLLFIGNIKNKPDNILDLTQTTTIISNLQSETTPNAAAIDIPRINIDSANIDQKETSRTFAPEKIYLFHESVTNSVATEEGTKPIEYLKNTMITNSTIENSVTRSVTESYSPVNDLTKNNSDTNIQIISTPPVRAISIGDETLNENNPLINLLLISPEEQIPYVQSTVPIDQFFFESTPIHENTVTTSNVIIALRDPIIVNDKASSVGLRHQEFHTESIPNNLDANLQQSQTNQILQNGTSYTKENSGTEAVFMPTINTSEFHKNFTQVNLDNNTLTTDTTNNKHIVGFENANQSLTTSNESKQPPYQDNGNSTLQNVLPNKLFQIKPTSTSLQNSTLFIDNLEAKQLKNQSNKGVLINDNAFVVTSNPNIRYTQNETEQTEEPIFSSTVNKQSNDNEEVKSHAPQGILPGSIKVASGAPTDISKIPSVTEENLTSKVKSHAPQGILPGSIKVASGAPTDISKIPSVTEENLTSKVKSNAPQGILPSSIKVASGAPTDISKIPSVTEENLTSKLYSSDTPIIQPITEPWIGTVVRKPFTNTLIAEQPSKEVASTEPHDKTPILSHVIIQAFNKPNIDEIRTGTGQKIDAKLTTGSTTEPWNKITQTTVQMTSRSNLDNYLSIFQVESSSNVAINTDSATTENHVASSSYKEFVDNLPTTMEPVITRKSKDPNLEAGQINAAVLIQNNLTTVTHFGVSVLPKPPRKSKDDESEKPEDIENKVIIEAKKEQTENKEEIMEENKTDALESSTELKEEPETGQYSQTYVKEYIDLTQASNPPKVISKNEFIGSENIASNNDNSTARYSPKTKSPPFVNIHNSPTPVFEQATNTRNFVCQPNRRGRFSDSQDCRKFYICIGKQDPLERFCPNNTVFSEQRKLCSKNLSHCVRNNQFQCVREGRFSDYFNDNIYYICVKNNVSRFVRYKLQCQSRYHLNKTSVRCALNTESSQSTSQQSTSDISKNNSDQSVSLATSEKLVEQSREKFKCKKEGKFPDANDRRKYYVCKKHGKSEYRQRRKKCDSDEIFNTDKKKCVDADSYECS